MQIHIFVFYLIVYVFFHFQYCFIYSYQVFCPQTKNFLTAASDMASALQAHAISWELPPSGSPVKIVKSGRVAGTILWGSEISGA